MIYQKNTIYAFDQESFGETDGLNLCMEEPLVDAENPIIPLGNTGAPDDNKLCYPASVDRWNDGFGFWYYAEDAAFNHTRCFAGSEDGFTWKKRGVIGEGIFNTMGLSFNVFNDGDRFLFPMTNRGAGPNQEANEAYPPLRPEDVPDPRRRELIRKHMEMNGWTGVKTFVGTAISEDGLQWSLPKPVPRIPMMLESPRIYRFQGRYLMNAQTHGAWFDPPVPGSRRTVFFASADLEHWEQVPGYMKNTAHESILGMTHVGIIPIKCIDDRLLIGIGGRFDEGTELPDTHFDATLLYSTNGTDWAPVVPRHERRSWIRRGRCGEWDFGGVVGMGMVEHGDDAAVYYSGTEKGNCTDGFPWYDPGHCQIGRVCFKRDRFAFLQPAVGWNAIFEKAQASTASGSATTKSITLAAERTMTLNAEIPENCGASVTVEVRTADGNRYDSARVTRGGVAAPVHLQKQPPREPIRIRLELTGGMAPDRVPQLYAIGY
jgi:hypothetical protein